MPKWALVLLYGMAYIADYIFSMSCLLNNVYSLKEVEQVGGILKKYCLMLTW